MAYTTIDDPSAYFQSILWTGNDTDGRALTNDGNSDLQPDLVWLKNRDAGYNHIWTDSTRGVTKNIYSNLTDAEATVSNKVESFDTNGFTVGYDGSQVPNKSPRTFVAWQWKANGGTTSSNTDGSITSTVQADTTAGFSIVTYTGNGTAGSTVGHGLGAVPAMVIFKCRSDASTDWRSYHQSISPTNAISFNSGGAAYTGEGFLFTSAFSSTQLKLENEGDVNGASRTYVAYCFAEKQGYSKFGKYVGNGNANGTFVYTGFKPAFLAVKVTDDARDWRMYDAKRDNFNVVEKYLTPNTTGAEGTTSTLNIDFLSNGFKLRGNHVSTNQSGKTFIYMAFAENPFVTSTGIPTTAR